MAAYTSSEVKSGLFISICVVLFFILLFMIGDFTSGKTREYQVEFGYISGLEENAPVYFAGREVGKVEGIEVVSGRERPIVIDFSVPESIHLKSDTEAFVDTLGLMGEKFLELTPGSSDAETLAPGDKLTGVDPIPMHLMISKMNVLADRMDELTQSLNPVMEQVDVLFREHSEDMGELFVNLRSISEDVNHMTSDLKEGHSDDISAMITNFKEISTNLREMTEDLKKRPWLLLRQKD